MSNSSDPVCVEPIPVNVAVAPILVLPNAPDLGSDIALSCGPDGEVVSAGMGATMS